MARETMTSSNLSQEPLNTHSARRWQLTSSLALSGTAGQGPTSARIPERLDFFDFFFLQIKVVVKTVVSNLGEEEGDGDDEADLDTAEVDVATLPLGAAGGEQSELLVGPRLLPHAGLLHLQGYFKVFKINFVIFKHNPSRPEVKLFHLAGNCDIY